MGKSPGSQTRAKDRSRPMMLRGDRQNTMGKKLSPCELLGFTCDACPMGQFIDVGDLAIIVRQLAIKQLVQLLDDARPARNSFSITHSYR